MDKKNNDKNMSIGVTIWTPCWFVWNHNDFIHIPQCHSYWQHNSSPGDWLQEEFIVKPYIKHILFIWKEIQYPLTLSIRIQLEMVFVLSALMSFGSWALYWQFYPGYTRLHFKPCWAFPNISQHLSHRRSLCCTLTYHTFIFKAFDVDFKFNTKPVLNWFIVYYIMVCFVMLCYVTFRYVIA